MTRMKIAEDFAQALQGLRDADDLTDLVGNVAQEMGFRYFAVAHHVDLSADRTRAVRLHNYPEGWAEWFDMNRLGRSDPVHRASQRSALGFAWSRLDVLIVLSPRDCEVLAQARRAGIGNGYTVPAHVPGECAGSCSFAMSPGEELPERMLPLAQLIGAFAFEGARRLASDHSQHRTNPQGLSDRQRDCVLWAARGKSDWEISRILGLSHETVIQYLKQARQRYGVVKRTQLAVHALFDGCLCFGDLLER